jgi:UDP-N-acetylmuramoyl-L-alanyl-D-glutamate--2,6-diaminopimelate ligase
MPTSLEHLLDDLDVVAVRGDTADVEITAVVHDSRRVTAGVLFCCIPGRGADGHDHATAAVERGAVAVLVERELEVDVPQIVVADVRVQMGRAAAALHGHPSRSLRMVGITGTNGKTTTALLLAAVLEAAGSRTATIGNLNAPPGGPPNTPDAPDLQARLAQLRDDGVDTVVMEVSSHALDQHRVEGVHFAVAVFTNLSQDHLDYHETMEDYFAAKARLFEPARSDRAVVNIDDPRGRLLRDAAQIPTVTYSLADVDDLRTTMEGSSGTWRGHPFRVPLAGRAHVANALAAATAAAELGVDEATIVAGLAGVPVAPGRFEVVSEGQPFGVVVDFAHTPDAVEQLLRTVRPLAEGRVTIVLGAGGDRDHTKRPVMGRVAGELADRVVLTSDNPRHEDPDLIIEEIRMGIGSAPEVVVDADRRAAIALALETARPGDVVLLAGKGHETTQQIGDELVPFDDRVVAREILTRLAGEGRW